MRSDLDAVFVQESSHDIFKRLKQLDIWQTKQSVHVYLPIRQSKEVDTRQVVRWLLESGHEVWTSYLPEDESKDGFCRISENTRYTFGRYDIPIPVERVVKDCQPDVIIAACVAADKTGNRLGHGNGWTDRFFAAHPKAYRIGLVYNQFLLDQIPSESHDQKLNVLVTESQIAYIR